MKAFKKIMTTGLMVVAIGASGVTAFAATQYNSPAEAVAELTGRTLESVLAERVETGKTYGAMALEADKLDEFKAESLEFHKENLAEQVAAGKLTQEKADAIIAALEESQESCDGTGNQGVLKSSGMKWVGAGNGAGNGNGTRNGAGNGTGMRNGSCR